MFKGAGKILRFLRKRTRRPRRFLVYVLTKMGIRGILLLSDHAAVVLGSWLGSAGYWLLRKYRLRTLRNLRLAFGDELNERQRREVALEVFRNCGRSMAEFVLQRRWRKADLERRVRFLGAEACLRTLDEGRGILVVVAHFGNWELAAAATVQCLGIPLGAVARELSNRGLDRVLNQSRAASGVQVFLRGRGVRPMVKHLKAGKPLAVLVDQDTHKGHGIFVPFFGRPALTQRGPGLLAWRQNVPIVPIAMVRNPDGFTHTLHIEEAIKAPQGAERDEAVEFLVRSYTGVFERHIRRFPSQWMWMHDRWRRQPNEDGEIGARLAIPHV